MLYEAFVLRSGQRLKKETDPQLIRQLFLRKILKLNLKVHSIAFRSKGENLRQPDLTGNFINKGDRLGCVAGG